MPKPMMIPKIDPVLDLVDGGMSVTVKGPAGAWDNDNVLAAFSAVVSQVNVSGSGAPSFVIAMGWVKYPKADYPPGADPEWNVTAKVIDGTRLQEGGAEVSAWTLYALKDGSSWMYEWRLPVILKNP
jgi:hypothetical protein